MNSDEVDLEVKETLLGAEMEAEKCRSQMKGMEQKMSELLEKLDFVLQCNGKLSVGVDFVMATINELQSLMQWTAEKTTVKADGMMVMEKLQHLEQIKKDLEKVAKESEEVNHVAILKSHEQTTDTINEENTETIAPSAKPPLDFITHENQMAILDSCLKRIEALSSRKTYQLPPKVQPSEEVLLIDLFSPDPINVPSPEPTPKKIKNRSRDSLFPNSSDDEGVGSSTGPNSYNEMQDLLSDIFSSSASVNPPLCGDAIVATEKDTIPKVIETKDFENQEDLTTLDIDVCAIKDSKSSSTFTELSVIPLEPKDKEEVAMLHDFILNLSRSKDALQSELKTCKSENESLKEQVLELEEAENDTRRHAQEATSLLAFFRAKNNSFQKDYEIATRNLEVCSNDLAEKEAENEELKSQLKYAEELVKQYEEHAREAEKRESLLREQLEEEKRGAIQMPPASIMQKVSKGSQTYELPAKTCHNCDVQKAFLEDEKHAKSISSMNEMPNVSHHSLMNSDVAKQVQVPLQNCFKDSMSQTECSVVESLALQIYGDEKLARTTSSLVCIKSPEETSQYVISSLAGPMSRELVNRIQQLIEDDAQLQQQLHSVDQINLTLWRKLHDLQIDVDKCKNLHLPVDSRCDSCFDSGLDTPRDSSLSTKDLYWATPVLVRDVEQSYQEIMDRVTKVEQINAAFEKELDLRNKLFAEKEAKYDKLVHKEQRFIADLKRLSDENESLTKQVSQLQREKKELIARAQDMKTKMDGMKEQHQKEIDALKTDYEFAMISLQQKIDSLQLEEMEYRKQITNLQQEKSRAADKTESDKLKSSYIELQLELSRTRDEKRRNEEEFKIRLEDAKSKYLLAEAKMKSELEVLRSKNSVCDELLRDFQSKQNELRSLLKQKEKEIEEARNAFQESMKNAEEQHRAVEEQLKQQLRYMEECTTLAKKAVADERLRFLKEMEENEENLEYNEAEYKVKIADLESQVQSLKEEILRLNEGNDAGFGPKFLHVGVSNYRYEKLESELKELKEKEALFLERTNEMDTKEAAYKETIANADNLVAHVTKGYKSRIAQLEMGERSLKQRIAELEEIEMHLKSDLHRERRSSNGRKADDLVQELNEAEARESALQDQIMCLEQLHRMAINKVKELEKIQKRLETELNDKDELSAKLQKAHQELETTRRALSQLKKSEEALKMSLMHSESLFSTTKSQMGDKLIILEEEKKSLEEMIAGMRAHIRELKQRLDEVTSEKDELMMHFTMYRTTTGKSTNVMKEPEYVDIDSLTPAQPKKTLQPREGKYQNHPDEKYQPSVASVKSRANGKFFSEESLAAEPARSTNLDSYDHARQNFEDCMMRAMSAMAKDIQKKDVQNKISMEEPEKEENDYDDVIPRPTNLRIVQNIGCDTLLIGWNYVNPSIIEAFEIYVDGQLYETVYSPVRTKALLGGLNLNYPVHVSVCALSRYGQTSEPTELQLNLSEAGIPCSNYAEKCVEIDELSDEESEKKRPYSMEW